MWLGPFFKRHRLYGGVAVALVVGLVFSLAASLGVFHGVRTLLSDQLFKPAAFHTDGIPPDDIVIAAVDGPSLAELGRFADWPRSYYAAAVDRLSAAGARLIVFDILFSESSPDDDALAAAIASAGNVILPYVYSHVAYASTASGRELSLENRIEPVPVLKGPSLTLGHAVMLPDQDGIVRQVPLYLGGAADLQPSLALATVAAYLRRPDVTDGPVTNGSLPLAGRDVPVDAGGNMRINYSIVGDGDIPFTEVSFSDVLAGTVPADVLNGRIVLIGVTAAGLGDTFWTPQERVMSGVELHAAAMQTVLSASFLREEPLWADFLVIVGLAGVAGWLVLKYRFPWGAVAAAGALAIFLVVAFIEFDRGVMVDLLFPPLAMIAAGAGVNAVQVLTEQAEKREVTRTFGRYVSPEIAGRILSEQRRNSIELEGASRCITALYIDARRFTGLMEDHPTELVFRCLNLYMKAIIASIQHHQGIVNKFAGDGLLAIWNAPVETEDHAVLAVRAALTCQQAIWQVRESGAAALPMEFGIGIMTGTAYLGTMGTRERREYSAFGDAVNSATRLSGMAPGGGIWLGAETYRLVEDTFTVTEVGEKTLKGRQQPLVVYEVSATDTHGDVNNP